MFSSKSKTNKAMETTENLTSLTNAMIKKIQSDNLTKSADAALNKNQNEND